MSKNTEIFIKSLGDSDIQRATEFAFKMLEEVYGRGIHPVWDHDLLNCEEIYVKTPGNTFFAAFNEDGKIIGTLAVRRYDDRIRVLKGFYDPKTTAELRRCFVDKRYRRRGIGTQLFKASEEFCKKNGYEVIYLHTHRYLQGAYEFWQSQGFKLRLDEGGSRQTLHMEKILFPKIFTD